MEEKDLEEIKAHFSLFWKLAFEKGFVRASYEIAESLKTGEIREFTGNMLVALALVNRFYTGNLYTDEVWDQARQYLIGEEELMR
jgi:hypothetical protein